MNQDTWRQIGPVLLSVLTIPLSLWIIYTGAKGDRATVSQFASALPLGIVGTVAFTAAVWLTSRAGWRLGPIIATDYLAWGVTIGLVLGLRRWLGG